MQRYCWSLTIGPAQQWIAQSRRSRDLAFGSRFLTHATAVTLSSLIEESGQQQGKNTFFVVIPAISAHALTSAADPSYLRSNLHEQSTISLPNRVSGFLSASSSGQVRALFDKAHAVFHAAWQDAARCAIPRKTSERILRELNAALNFSPLTLTWVCKPLPPESGLETNSDGLQQTERLLNAAKDAPRLTSFPPGTPVPKCMQCGLREAVGGSTFDEWRIAAQEMNEHVTTSGELRFDSGEHLCAVCMIRRHAGYLSVGSFASTSRVASQSWRRNLGAHGDPGVKQSFKQLENVISSAGKALGFGSDATPLLYPRTVRRLLAENQDAELRTLLQNVQAASTALGSTLDHARRLTETREPVADAALAQAPSEYLAVIMLDGDDFGEHLRAYQGKGIEKDLIQFSSQDLPELTKSHDGTAFYAGGDEALLLFPMDQAIPFALSMHRAWQHRMKAYNATVSCGIALFDRERPLSPALTAAHETLKAAKRTVVYNSPPKSALAVATMVSSGTSWLTAGKWNQWDAFNHMQFASGVSVLANADLRRVREFLLKLPSPLPETLRAAVAIEIKRLLHACAPDVDPAPWLDDLHTSMPMTSDWLRLQLFLRRENGLPANEAPTNSDKRPEPSIKHG